MKKALGRFIMEEIPVEKALEEAKRKGGKVCPILLLTDAISSSILTTHGTTRRESSLLCIGQACAWWVDGQCALAAVRR
jgi:hypothetical protein